MHTNTALTRSHQIKITAVANDAIQAGLKISDTMIKAGKVLWMFL